MSSTGQSHPTRKEQREEARAERKSVEAQHQQAQARRRRLMQIGGIAVVGIVAIAIAVAIGTSGSGSKTSTKPNPQATAEVNTLLAGIHQSGNVLGNPNAPVTMEYYGDLECPICQEFTLGAFPSIVKKYVRSGQLKVQYRAMRTATHEPTVFLEQQAAALAAGKQSLMWHYVENFYHHQGAEGSGYVTPAFLKERASEIPGLSVAKWEEERHNPKLAEAVEKDTEAAGENGFNGTPAFLLVKAGKPTKKLESFTNQQLSDASALFGPEIEKMLKS
jgi:protein-disulfide isomerase